MGKQKKKSSIATIVIMLLFAAVILVGFYYIANNTNNKEEEVKVPQTEIEKILAKDLEISYPDTPREVIKLYSRISRAYYNKQYTEEQLDQLVDQYRLLLDDELLEKNGSKANYMKKLKSDIKSYEKEKKTITSYLIEENSSTKYTTVDKRECASLNVAYMLKQDGKYKKLYERFLLRKDKDGKWKIVGWGSVSKKDVTIE
ncbi:hypothetical protein lbkm_3070 [Lachnospiraceae bacterium KM106-2]|nr:hypothetical protein lbkm_3070 [Lachnospiraceae bacterium KM106-2]